MEASPPSRSTTPRNPTQPNPTHPHPETVGRRRAVVQFRFVRPSVGVPAERGDELPDHLAVLGAGPVSDVADADDEVDPVWNGQCVVVDAPPGRFAMQVAEAEESRGGDPDRPCELGSDGGP